MPDLHSGVVALLRCHLRGTKNTHSRFKKISNTAKPEKQRKKFIISQNYRFKNQEKIQN